MRNAEYPVTYSANKPGNPDAAVVAEPDQRGRERQVEDQLIQERGLKRRELR